MEWGVPTTRAAARSDVVYIVLRRMRAPLLVLIAIFSFCTIGLSLVPGVDANGNRAAPMTLFEAFYVISYTGLTIGFGEIPQPYSTQQRMWMVVTIYLTVVGWSYAGVNLIALVTERGFQNAMRINRFSRRIYHLREPFYIVCGAGETGALVCHGLDRLNYRFVVVEISDERLQRMRLEDFHADAPMIVADASQPAVLQEAGLMSEHCKGVVALADDDRANQAIAVTVRLLRQRAVRVLARIRDAEIETDVGVFGGDIVINPFDRFAEHLGDAVAQPQHYRLREILYGLAGEPLPEEHRPPQGHWIVCGYGRFGRAVVEKLREGGNTVAVVDVKYFDEGGVDVRGTGTDSESLTQAGIDHAVGIVAGNVSDTKNLAIAVTARDMRGDLFIVTRMNQSSNAPLFDAFQDDLAMVPSRIVAQEFLSLITTPLLAKYLETLPFHSEEQCRQLSDLLADLNGGRIPELFNVTINDKQTRAACTLLEADEVLTLGQIMRDPYDRSRRIPATALLVLRHREVISDYLLTDTFVIKKGDQLLIAGSVEARSLVQLTLQNPNSLDYVRTGAESSGLLWRWLRSKWAAHRPRTRPVHAETVERFTEDNPAPESSKLPAGD